MSFSPNPLASVFPWDDADSMQDYAGMIALYSKRIAVISVCYFVVVDTRIVPFSFQLRFCTICKHRHTVYISARLWT